MRQVLDVGNNLIVLGDLYPGSRPSGTEGAMILEPHFHSADNKPDYF